ncbi:MULTISPECIES: transposase, partial [unclassified Granulicatella]|uniref:transposase n=2 Tax=unclassified Granulicatella TaxID=2630493 RepID=UPI0011008BD8
MQQAVISCKQTYSYLPKVLCIDEFKALKTSYSKMNFIYVDGESGKIIDILPTRQCRYLLSYFLKYSRKQRLNVRYVVMDMNAHYGSWIKQVFPNAEIVTDRFHIVQHINRTFNQLRCQIMKKYLNQSDSTQQKMGRRMKRYGRLLMKYEEDLDDKKYVYHYLFKTELTETMIVNEILLYDEELKE